MRITHYGLDHHIVSKSGMVLPQEAMHVFFHTLIRKDAMRVIHEAVRAVIETKGAISADCDYVIMEYGEHDIRSFVGYARTIGDDVKYGWLTSMLDLRFNQFPFTQYNFPFINGFRNNAVEQSRIFVRYNVPAEAKTHSGEFDSAVERRVKSNKDLDKLALKYVKDYLPAQLLRKGVDSEFLIRVRLDCCDMHQLIKELVDEHNQFGEGLFGHHPLLLVPRFNEVSPFHVNYHTWSK